MAEKKTTKPKAWQDGKKAVQIWLTEEQREKIAAAADLDLRPITQFLVQSGLERAEKILEKSRKK